MIRLRYKIIALFLFSVLVAIVGTVFFTTNTFLVDKRDYIMDLNSMAAPRAALIIDKIILQQREFLNQFEDVLSQKKDSKKISQELQSLFKPHTQILQIQVFDRAQKLVLALGRQQSLLQSESSAAENLNLIDQQQPYLLAAANDSFQNTSQYLILKTKTKNYYFVLVLPVSIFQEGLEAVKAFSAALMTPSGPILIQESNGKHYFLEPALKPYIADFFKLQNQQTTMAWRIKTESQKQVLMALSVLPGASKVAVAVLVPDTEAALMAAQIVQNSLPFIGGVLLLVSGLGFIFSRQLTKPLEELTEATGHIASGQWQTKLNTKSDDEIGRLVRSFSKMGHELQLREQALQKAHEELLRADRLASLGQFSAGIAHEIKNPLASVLTYAQLIQRKVAGEPSAPDSNFQFAQYIVDETKRASRIITDLLTFARQKPPVLKAENFTVVLNHVMKVLDPQLQAQNVILVKDYEEEKKWICQFDQDQIIQVLQNLIMNAIQAMAEQASEKKISLQLFSEADFLVLQIRDSGPGISEENLAHLFEPFFSTKKTGQGAGLGLSLCLGIIEQHGGKIEVKSKLFEGAEFRVLLPLG